MMGWLLVIFVLTIAGGGFGIYGLVRALRSDIVQDVVPFDVFTGKWADEEGATNRPNDPDQPSHLT